MAGPGEKDGPRSLRPGAQVDRYELLAPIGEGAMGQVWRARHTVTEGDCALKILHWDLARNEHLSRLFVQEAQVGARLGTHPSITRVLDAGVDEGFGIPFLAMELLDGETLEDRRARLGPMDWGLAAQLFWQLGDAVQHAHEAGVVHRDLKPVNLFLTRDRYGAPLLKVFDFGIARLIEEGKARTATDIGTPAYAAPEQLGAAFRELAAQRGIRIARGVSPATDVWAFGLVAYDLLTGLDAADLWGGVSAAELPLKIVFEKPLCPSRQAGAARSRLPPHFDDWFAGCTARDAAERWPSMREAARVLVGLLTEPARAVEDSRPTLEAAPAVTTPAAADPSPIDLGAAVPAQLPAQSTMRSSPAEPEAPTDQDMTNRAVSVSRRNASRSPHSTLRAIAVGAGMIAVLVVLAMLALGDPKGQTVVTKYALEPALPEATVPPEPDGTAAKAEPSRVQPTLTEAPTVATPEEPSVPKSRTASPAAATMPGSLPSGTVVVTASPNTDIMIDGRRMGRTPLNVQISPGTHSLAAIGGAHPRALAVYVEAGKTTRVEFQPPATDPSPAQPAVGRLNVNSIPPSKVILDGRPVGTTPRIGLAVTAGAHTVTFIHREHGRKTTTVKVAPGEVAVAAVTFP